MNETSLGGRVMWGGEGVEASYPDEWTWRRVDDQKSIVAGSVGESVEHLAACSAGRAVAEASSVVDVVDVDAASTSWPFVDLGVPSQRGVRVVQEKYRVSADQYWGEASQDSYR